MQLVVNVPDCLLPEATYVLDWVLHERFGFPKPVILPYDGQDIIISAPDVAGIVRAPCIGGWGPSTKPGRFCLPPAPLSKTSGGADGAKLVIMFGQPGQMYDDGSTTLSFDFWGTIFWCLTRVEELETDVRDRHGRFSASQSYLKRNDILLRPIVDEYVEYLWGKIQILWSDARRRADDPKVLVTCDVDTPYSRSLGGPTALVRSLGADIIRERSIRAAFITLHNAWRVKTRNDYGFDPNNTFAWIMDQCEALGLPAAFYFIAANHAIDPRYDLGNPFVQKLLLSIRERGHEIGMHGSYVTYRDAAALKRELADIRSTCHSLGIALPNCGNRQHYLRWDVSVTPDALDEAGFSYDTTLGFADSAGFRCGTCHEFPIWSWQHRRPLALRERPLIVMEATVFEPIYMGLDAENGQQLMLTLKETCQKYGGNFILLWHNSYFQSEWLRDCYLQVLKG